MAEVRCPFAHQVPDHHQDRHRRGPVYGLAIHQTGRGIVGRADRENKAPKDVALEYYQGATDSTHYLCDYDGTLYQISDEDRRVPHIGVAAEERREYLDGSWVHDFPAAVVERWRARWPGVASPQHLYPDHSPNSDYVGVEMLPLPHETEQGLRYTPEQHVTIARLAADVAQRHGWPDGWQHSGRLITHEDVDAYGRWQHSGGWDPGVLRAAPWFRWDVMVDLIEAALVGEAALAFVRRALGVTA